MSLLNRTLRELTCLLTRLGYAAFYNSMNPLADDTRTWVCAREQALPQLQPCIDLLLLGKAVPLQELNPQLMQILGRLVPCGLFSYAPEGCIRSSGLSLHPVFGLWLFRELPNPRVSLYFGQDSVALLTRQMPRTGGTCLDLCSGPGVQALNAAKNGEQVTSAEINPQAAWLATINAAMNGLEDRMDIRTGDLYAALPQDAKFDRIIANPPLLPVPEDLPYVLVGHGGNDGLKITWRILEGLPQHLTEQGFAQIIGVGLGQGCRVCFREPMEQRAKALGLDVIINVVNSIPVARGDRFFRSMVETILMGYDLPEEEVADKLDQCFRSQGANRYVVFDLLVTHGTGQVQVQDLSLPNNNKLWYI